MDNAHVVAWRGDLARADHLTSNPNENITLDINSSRSERIDRQDTREHQPPHVAAERGYEETSVLLVAPRYGLWD